MAEPQTSSIPLQQEQVAPWRERLPQALAALYLLAALAAVLMALRGLNRTDLSEGPALFAGLVHTLCAVWVFWVARTDARARTLAVLLASTGVALTDLFLPLGLTPPAWLLAVALGSAALFALGLLYPPARLQEAPPSRLRWLGYAGAALFGLGMRVFGWSHPALAIAMIALAVLAGAFLQVRVLLWQKMAPPAARTRAQLGTYALLASYGPLLLWLLLNTWMLQGLTFSPFLLLLTVIFPLSAGFLARNERVWQVNFVLNRVALYSAIAALVIFGYALLVSGLSVLLSGILPPGGAQPFLAGVIFFLLALAFEPLRRALRGRVDRVFARGERGYQERLQDFGNEMTGLVSETAILARLREVAGRVLQPDGLHVFLFDPQGAQYAAAPDARGQRSSDLRFAENSPLAGVLHRRTGSLLLHDLDHLPAALQPDQTRMRLLDAVVYVPLSGQQRLNGWMALGPHQSGEAYTGRELNFLDALCDQAALALERARVAAGMENRAREMAALTRLAQGINITLSFTDILELIYAQTSQIIPLEDFELLLLEPETGFLQPVFFISNDERLESRENLPLPETRSLEWEVVRQRKALMAEAYPLLCQQHGCTPQMADWRGWMCVPLNAGAETIGALITATRSARDPYAPGQLNLLQSVADQAAGAIVKTRLLHEAERRARQLATLNEVTRKLTSTLELDPLLQTILTSAVDILNCDAGSLLLVDAERSELVFQVTVGPVAGDLVGRRMPLNTGLAGKAVLTRQSVIVNNVHESPEWFSRTDQQTGFITRAVLVTPLVIKENMIGVVEVINRKDGLHFGKDDVALLEAFAAQAAVAIENARLYTMTDLALAARVEELSVMQRIDRELNASLDTSNAMQTTLQWAMRQSGAEAGLVAGVYEDGQVVRVIAAQGYEGVLPTGPDGRLPAGAEDLQAMLTGGRSVCRTLEPASAGALLPGARSQVVIPIQREEKGIGALLLESAAPAPVSQETLHFLERLSDHASVAISNAQLYAAVQAANVAKSEFVSFVSHELKNPMTSVKGFTDLLAAGAVGSINDTQANFLATIRSNVDRINTLISDLNDMSKIEANRLRLDFKAFALSEAVEEVARSTRRQIEDKNQSLQVLTPEELPDAWADRTRLVQVLVNLVSNANKYTEKGGAISLGAEACENQWDPRGARRVLHIWVRDSGIGINEADQKKIFQKFFRSDDPKTREAPGTGLGLNITKSLVEMQGGQIWFDSIFREGTTFHFTVPIAE